MYIFSYEINRTPFEVTVSGKTMAEALDEFHRFCEDGPHCGVRVRLTDIKETNNG